MHAPVRRYARVAVAAWQCRTAAGDAAASWTACRDGQSHLRRIPGIGWCGSIHAQPGIALDDLALQAAHEPWTAIAHLPDPPAFACAASKGDPQTMQRAWTGDPAALIQAGADRPTMTLARRLGIRHLLPVPAVAACSTGLYALLAAADLLDDQRCQRALIGASDACLTPLIVAGFTALGVLCGDEPPGAGRGFAPAEGAGFTALAATGPWRLVAGVRLGDAGHETQFTDPRTLHTALEALWSVLPHPDLIVVHGTGTAVGDPYEEHGLASGPWRDAPRLACKPFIGHCLGASGSVELALALEAPVRRLWKLSLGFGGHLAAVALERA